MDKRTVCTGLAAGLFLAGVAQAADTVETWGGGASDTELYVGADGLRGEEQALYGEMVLGYGLVEGASAYLGVTVMGDHALANAAQELALGVFGTPLDTDHFDVDLFLELRRSEVMQVTPALELNPDAAPGLEAWGAYVRLAAPVHGHEAADGGHERAFHLEVNPGLYWSPSAGHQLLAEYDMALHPASRDPTLPTAEIGGVALGYNVALSDALELINQVYWDVPEGGQTSAVGVMTGFIATLPSTR